MLLDQEEQLLRLPAKLMSIELLQGNGMGSNVTSIKTSTSIIKL
jgi:hypothetical protein